MKKGNTVFRIRSLLYFKDLKLVKIDFRKREVYLPMNHKLFEDTLLNKEMKEKYNNNCNIFLCVCYNNTDFNVNSVFYITDYKSKDVITLSVEESKWVLNIALYAMGEKERKHYANSNRSNSSISRSV